MVTLGISWLVVEDILGWECWGVWERWVLLGWWSGLTIRNFGKIGGCDGGGIEMIWVDSRITT